MRIKEKNRLYSKKKIWGCIGLFFVNSVAFVILLVYIYRHNGSEELCSIRNIAKVSCRSLFWYTVVPTLILFLRLYVSSRYYNKLCDIDNRLKRYDIYDNYMIYIDHNPEIKEWIINNRNNLLESSNYLLPNGSTIMSIISLMVAILSIIIGPLFSSLQTNVIMGVMDKVTNIILFIIYIFVSAILIIHILSWPYQSKELEQKIKIALEWYNMHEKRTIIGNERHSAHYKIIRKIKKCDKKQFREDLNKNVEMKKFVKRMLKEKVGEVTYDETEKLVEVFSSFQLSIIDFWTDKKYYAKLKNSNNKM